MSGGYFCLFRLCICSRIWTGPDVQTKDHCKTTCVNTQNIPVHLDNISKSFVQYRNHWLLKLYLSGGWYWILNSFLQLFSHNHTFLSAHHTKHFKHWLPDNLFTGTKLYDAFFKEVMTCLKYNVVNHPGFIRKVFSFTVLLFKFLPKCHCYFLLKICPPSQKQLQGSLSSIIPGIFSLI